MIKEKIFELESVSIGGDYERTTRDDLKRLVKALEEKRERVRAFQKEGERIVRLEEKAKQLADKEVECERIKAQIEASLSEFDRYGIYYKNGNAFAAETLMSQIRAIQLQSQEICKEQETVRIAINKKNKSSVQSFIEAVEARNTLSTAEIAW
ncbi:hypothetical protein P4K96_26470 [Bacillus cereus]|nr:hypothetical protein [Bacillus cereus]